MPCDHEPTKFCFERAGDIPADELLIAAQCRLEQICPGWVEHVYKLGAYSYLENEGTRFKCKPCEPDQEMWISIDKDLNHHNAIGVSICFPNAEHIVREYSDPLMFVAMACIFILLFKKVFMNQ